MKSNLVDEVVADFFALGLRVGPLAERVLLDSRQRIVQLLVELEVELFTIFGSGSHSGSRRSSRRRSGRGNGVFLRQRRLTLPGTALCRLRRCFLAGRFLSVLGERLRRSVATTTFHLNVGRRKKISTIHGTQCTKRLPSSSHEQSNFFTTTFSSRPSTCKAPPSNSVTVSFSNEFLEKRYKHM